MKRNIIMPVKASAVLLLGLLVAFSAGCRSGPSAAGLMMETYPSTRVKVNSLMFAGWFRVVNSALAKGENDLLRATITLENLRNSDCAIEYRFRWIDADGIEITSGMTTWISKSAGARETLLLTGIAPARSAEDFILDVRFVHHSTRWL